MSGMDAPLSCLAAASAGPGCGLPGVCSGRLTGASVWPGLPSTGPRPSDRKVAESRSTARGQACVLPAGPEGPFAAHTHGLLQAQAHQLSAR